MYICEFFFWIDLICKTFLRDEGNILKKTNTIMINNLVEGGKKKLVKYVVKNYQFIKKNKNFCYKVCHQSI